LPFRGRNRPGITASSIMDGTHRFVRRCLRRPGGPGRPWTGPDQDGPAGQWPPVERPPGPPTMAQRRRARSHRPAPLTIEISKGLSRWSSRRAASVKVHKIVAEQLSGHQGGRPHHRERRPRRNDGVSRRGDHVATDQCSTCLRRQLGMGRSWRAPVALGWAGPGFGRNPGRRGSRRLSAARKWVTVAVLDGFDGGGRAQQRVQGRGDSAAGPQGGPGRRRLSAVDLNSVSGPPVRRSE